MEPLLSKILRSEDSARWITESVRLWSQGQRLDLLVRPSLNSPFYWVATIAGSSLSTITSGEWRQALDRIAEGLPSRTEEAGRLLVGEYCGRPMLWRVPTEPVHWPDFVSLQEHLTRLQPVALNHHLQRDAMRHRLITARSVEAWQKLVNSRRESVRALMEEVLDWALDEISWRTGARPSSPPALFLVGSNVGSPNLMSDVDFLPVWPAAAGHDAAGREVLERLATGLNACGVHADNLAATCNFHEQMGLSLTNWPTEVAGIPSPLRFASNLQTLPAAQVAGNETVAHEFVTALTKRPGRLSPRRWRRRWTGWWASTQQALSHAPSAPDALLAPLYRQQSKVLEEIIRVLPQHAVSDQLVSDYHAVNARLAWMRDLVCLGVLRRGGEDSSAYVERLGQAAGLNSAGEFNSWWTRCREQQASVTSALFRAAGLSFWHGSLGQLVARNLWVPPWHWRLCGSSLRLRGWTQPLEGQTDGR